MSNKHRGEMEVKLNGKSYTLRATFDALARIEDRVGCGVSYLLEKSKIGDITIKQIESVLEEGARAGGQKMTEKDCEELQDHIIDEGINGAGIAVVQFLVMALTGGPEYDRIAQQVKARDEDDEGNA